MARPARAGYIGPGPAAARGGLDVDEARYDPGQVVFAEGDPSLEVLLILEGEVEVLKASGPGGAIVLGRIGPGQFVGEMGVIEGRPRSATVRAADAVRGERLDRDGFLERISAEPHLAFEALRRLSERLHAADLRLADTRPPPPPALAAPTKVLLTGASEGVDELLPQGGVVLDRLPYHVGRRPQPGESRPDSPVRLELDDEPPYRLSRRPRRR